MTRPRHEDALEQMQFIRSSLRRWHQPARTIAKFLLLETRGKFLLLNSYFPLQTIHLNRAGLRTFKLFAQPRSWNWLQTFLQKHPDAVPVVADLIERKFIVPLNFDEKRRLGNLRRSSRRQWGFGPVYIVASMRCNFGCPGCHFYSGKQPTPRSRDQLMSPSMLRRHLSFIMKRVPKSHRRGLQFIFYGGEPLLNKPLLAQGAKLIRRMFKESSILLATNGSLMDDDVITTIIDFGMKVQISLDGARASNDLHRRYPNGRGTFVDIAEGIKKLEAADVDYTLSWTISDATLSRAEKDVPVLARMFQTRSVIINLMQCFSGQKVHVSAKKLDRHLHRLYDQLEKHGYHEHRVARYKHLSNGMPYHFYCGACGGTQFVLLPDGRVGLCHGNVFDDQFRFAASGNRGRGARTGWWSRSPLSMPVCYEGCEYFSICPGGCPYESLKKQGDAFVPDPMMCAREKFFIRRALFEQTRTT